MTKGPRCICRCSASGRAKPSSFRSNSSETSPNKASIPRPECCMESISSLPSFRSLPVSANGPMLALHNFVLAVTLTLFRTRSAPLRRHVDVCRNHAYQPSPSRRLDKAQQDTAVAAHFALWWGCLLFRGLTREGGRQWPAPDLDPRAACLTSSKALD